MNKLRLLQSIIILLMVVSCKAYRYVPEISMNDMEMHLKYLASDKLQGRYPGTEGDIKAARYIEERFEELGLETGRQEFSFVQSVRRGSLSSFAVNGKLVSPQDYSPFGFASDTMLDAGLVFAGYGITVKTDSFEWDDYKGIDVKGQWVMVLRGTPDIPKAEGYLSMAADDRDKAMLAADNGAAGIIMVSGYRFDPDDNLVKVERKMAPVAIPAFHVSRSLADSILRPGNHSVQEIETKVPADKQSISFKTEVEIKARPHIENVTGHTGNTYAILNGSDPVLSKEFVVVGAHYDHLGNGGPGSSSRRPDTLGVHNGADDNASGVSLMLELAGTMKQKQKSLKRSVVFAAFGAEEMGLLGSKHFVNNMPVDLSAIVAMVNLDMVGRLDTARGLQVGGTGTSIEADSLIRMANHLDLKLKLSKEGSGPSDHSSFYGKDIPVFFITTGAHADYHTPADDVERINLSGMMAVADFTENLIAAIDGNDQKLTFMEAGPKETAGPGYRFRITLGFMPDFSSTDIQGVRVDFVSKGKAAERGGIKNGDIITAIDGLAVRNIYDYMYRLGKLSKNQIISVEVMRDGKKEILLIQL